MVGTKQLSKQKSKRRINRISDAGCSEKSD